MSEIFIYINNGKVTQLEVLSQFFTTHKDGKYLLSTKNAKKRSLPQNAYYWGIMVPSVRNGLYHAGYDEVKTNDDAHEVIKHLHLKKQIVNKHTGELLSVVGSTAKLSTTEFMEFVENVCRWASMYLGIVIPMPNEELIMNAVSANYDDVRQTIM